MSHFFCSFSFLFFFFSHFSLAFNSLLMCLDMDLFVFILIFCWPSWICRFMFFIKFHKLLAVDSSSIFYPFLFVCTPFTHILVYMILFPRLLELTCMCALSHTLSLSRFSFLSVFHLYSLGNFCLPIFRFSVFFLSTQVCCWNHMVSFLFLLLYFSVGPIFIVAVSLS